MPESLLPEKKADHHLFVTPTKKDKARTSQIGSDMKPSYSSEAPSRLLSSPECFLSPLPGAAKNESAEYSK